MTGADHRSTDKLNILYEMNAGDHDFTFASSITEALTYAETEIQSLVIAFANLLYKIDLAAKDKKLLWKLFRKNEDFKSSVDVKKKDFDSSILDTVCDALKYKRESEEGGAEKA